MVGVNFNALGAQCITQVPDDKAYARFSSRLSPCCGLPVYSHEVKDLESWKDQMVRIVVSVVEMHIFHTK